MIHLWVRRTLDWSDEAAFWAQLEDRWRPGVEIWNKTLSMPFHVFRARVREIAALNQSRLRNVRHSDWESIPDGSLVLPTDDDDWFDPRIGEVLAAQLDDGAIACRWPSRWFEVPLSPGHHLHLLRHRWLGRPLMFFCTTNNYALVKRPDSQDLLRLHTRASAWFEARLEEPGRGDVRLLDEPLSVANRTLGSATVVDRIGGRRNLLRRLRRYRRLYRRRIPSELEWTRPYVAEMAALMDDLKPL
jgi:hypothetical protein